MKDLIIDDNNSSFSGYIGISENEITPPEGIYMGNWGAAISPVSTGLHKPLTMTCMTFQQNHNEDPLVLLGVDLGWWKDRNDEILFRQVLLRKFNLPSSHLLICLSHTHAGPSICRMDVEKPGGEHIQVYLNQLEESAINLIEDSLEKSEKSILTWKYGTCNLATNRDLKDPDGSRYLTGFNPQKEADNLLLCGRITNDEGEITGSIVNYACHPTTLAWGNTLISPDYIGSMRETIKDVTHSPVMFIQGASGDLAPIHQYVGDTKVADQHGRQLGYAVLSVLESMSSPGMVFKYDYVVESGAPLAIWNEKEIVPSNQVSVMEVGVRYEINDFPTYNELQKKWNESSDTVQKERLWRKMGIRSGLGDGDEADIPLWIWKLGGAYLVAQPNEAYAVYQQDIRKAFSGHPIVIGNLVNGSIGYLPPQDLYKENIYTVWQTPFSKGSLETLIRETRKILSHLESES